MKVMSSSPLAIALCAFLLGLSGCIQPDPLPGPDDPVLSSAKALTAFSIGAATGTIDEAGKTVAVTLPLTATVTALKATFTVSAKATVNVSGVAQVSGTTAHDFKSPVTYTVQAENGTTVDYVVTVTQETTLTSGAAADVVLGQPDFTSSTAPTGASANSLHNPGGTPIVVGTKLFLPDTFGHRILVFNTVPTTNNAAADYAIGAVNLVTVGTGAADATGIDSPHGVWSNGTLLAVTDTGNRRVTLYSSVPTTSPGTATIVVGQPDFSTTTAGTTASKVSFPTGMFVTGTKLLIADNVNSRVLIWNTLPTTHGQDADLVLGQADFTSSDPGTTDNTLASCTDVWSDGTRVIVADDGNNRVLIWNTFPTYDGQPADVVVGQADFTSYVQGDGAAGLFDANCISSNGTMLAVADSSNNRVLIWKKIPTTNGKAADIVLGQPDFTTVSAGTTATKMSYPYGLFLDKKRLIVSDTNNNRALIFNL